MSSQNAGACVPSPTAASRPRHYPALRVCRPAIHALGHWLILAGRLSGCPDRFSGLGCRFGRWPFVVGQGGRCPPGRGAFR